MPINLKIWQAWLVTHLLTHPYVYVLKKRAFLLIHISSWEHIMGASTTFSLPRECIFSPTYSHIFNILLLHVLNLFCSFLFFLTEGFFFLFFFLNVTLTCNFFAEFAESIKGIFFSTWRFFSPTFCIFFFVAVCLYVLWFFLNLFYL